MNFEKIFSEMISLNEEHRRKDHYRENIMVRRNKQQICVRSIETSFPAEGEGPLTKNLEVFRIDQNAKRNLIPDHIK